MVASLGLKIKGVQEGERMVVMKFPDETVVPRVRKERGNVFG